MQLEQFSSIRVGIKLHKLHVFGVPVFALSNELASGSSLPKWSIWCRLGIHLGPLNEQAQNVCLVLNPSTRLVSPKYHCRFDDFFESVRFQNPELTVPTTWRRLSKLTRDNTPTSWEPQEGSKAKFSNTSGVDKPQEETDTFKPPINNFEQDEHHQAPPHSIQDDTVENKPIAR